jgi:hypothetical protein
MGDSKTAQKGLFHRVTGVPFTQAIGWQKPANPIDTRNQQIQRELRDAIERKEAINQRIEQVGQNAKQYQTQISEYKKERVKNFAATQGRMIVKQVDSDWGHLGIEPSDSDFNDQKKFHADREYLWAKQREAENKYEQSEKMTADLHTQLEQTQKEICTKTAMSENPVPNSGTPKE